MEQPQASQRELLKAAERLEMARLLDQQGTDADARADSQRVDAGPARRARRIAKRHEAERNRQTVT
jgi:hypothetical protein